MLVSTILWTLLIVYVILLDTKVRGLEKKLGKGE